MKPELAIITTEFLKDFVNNSMKEILWNGKYTIYPYMTFKDIPQIYNSIPDKVQGVITSGSFPSQVINHSFPKSDKIVNPFNNDDAGLYKLFLQILYHNKNISINRIYADLLEIGKVDIYEYLLGKQKSDISIFIANEVKKMSLEQLFQAEEEYCKKHIKMWEKNKIDISITRFSSIVNKLQDIGIPVYFAYPSISYLENICFTTAQEVVIKNLKENQISAILITAKIDKNIHEKKKLLLKYINKFNNIMQNELLIQEKDLGYEIITNRKSIEKITDNFSTCQLQEFLKSKLDFNVYIGYGIGSTLYQARINAIDANREASLSLKTASCLINEKDELMSLLKESNTFIVPRIVTDAVKKISSVSGLSTFTIQKVFSAAKTMEDYMITSEELSIKLSITKRSANRFLSSLKKADMAEIVGQKQSTTKGRPELIYKIFVEKI